MTINEAGGGQEEEERSQTKTGGKEQREGKGTTDNGDLRVDGEGRWQCMKLYTHNDPAALYRADKAA